MKVKIPRLDPTEPDNKTRWMPGSELGREGGLWFRHMGIREPWATRTPPGPQLSHKAGARSHDGRAWGPLEGSLRLRWEGGRRARPASHPLASVGPRLMRPLLRLPTEGQTLIIVIHAVRTDARKGQTDG